MCFIICERCLNTFQVNYNYINVFYIALRYLNFHEIYSNLLHNFVLYSQEYVQQCSFMSFYNILHTGHLKVNLMTYNTIIRNQPEIQFLVQLHIKLVYMIKLNIFLKCLNVLISLANACPMSFFYEKNEVIKFLKFLVHICML